MSAMPGHPFKSFVLSVLMALSFSATSVSGAETLADATEQFRFADGLYLRGLHDMAAREYLLILRDKPDFEHIDAVYFRLAECYRRMGASSAADRYYQRVSAEFPESEYTARSRLRRAELFIESEQYEAAVELFAGLLKDKPVAEIEAAALYYLGLSLAHLERDADAEQTYTKLLKQHPQAPFASYGRLELARMKSGNERKKLLEALAAAPATPRLGAEAHFQLAAMAFEGGDDAAGLTHFTAMRKKYPEEPRVADIALSAAWARYREGRYADALELCTSFGDTPINTASWLYLRANTERQLLNNDAALDSYAELREKHPASEVTLAAIYESALIHYNRKDYSAAIAELEGVEAPEALRTDFLWLLAEAHSALGQEAQAVQYYRLLTREGETGPRAADSLFRLGRLLQQRGDHIEASRIFRRLADGHSGSEKAERGLYASAVCRMQEQQYDEAITDWTRLITEYAETDTATEALFERGALLAHLERHAEAISDFESYLGRGEHATRKAGTWYRLGIAQASLEQFEAAETSLRTALEESPDTELEGRIKLRIVMLLQKTGRAEASSELLQDIVQSPLATDLPPALLEWLVRLRMERGEWELARAAAESLLKASEQSEVVFKQIGAALMGRILRELGETEASQKYLRQAIAQPAHSRDGALAAIQLAEMALEVQNHDLAATYFSSVAESASAPELADVRARAYFGLGEVADARGDPLEAGRYFLSVAVLYDDPLHTPRALYRAYTTFERAGRTREAGQARDELLERFPDSEQAAQVQEAAKDKE